MEKILFFGNTVEDFAEYHKYRDVLEKNEIELAFTTFNKDLIPEMAVNKMLVVAFGEYTPDVVVVRNPEHKKLFKHTVWMLDELREVIESD